MNLMCDLSNLCRTCATESVNMSNLFEYHKDGENLADKIFVCTQVHIINHVNRSANICNSCKFQLEQAYEFQKLVKESEQTFQQMMTSEDTRTMPFTVPEIKKENVQDYRSTDNIVEIEKTSIAPVLIDVVPQIEAHQMQISQIETITSKSSGRKPKNEKTKKAVTSTKKRIKNEDAKTFECYKCRERFSSFWRTSVHLKQHTAGEYKCIVCAGRFILWEQFNKHLCQSIGLNIKCSYCDQMFVTTISLLNHLDHSHDEKTLFKCEKCAQFFSMALLKQHHVGAQHANVEVEETLKQFKCNICDKRFGTKISLRNHEEIHSDAKPFLCFECGKRFKTSSSLHTHRISHSEKTLKCPDCPMTFNRIAGFRKHRNVHLNLKYKCNLCHAELRSKDALERHTRRHRLTDDDKRHHCTFCPMKFFKRDKLTRHIRTHTGEKPFKCPFCSDRAYAQKGDLTKHIKLKHVGNEIYKCDLCQEGFQYYADLKTHSFEHYKEEKAKQEASK